MRLLDAELNNMPCVPKKPVLCHNAVSDEEGHPLDNEDVEGPRHHQYEDILRFVQKDPDDIHWTMEKTDFEELIAMKNDSSPVPNGIPNGAKKCAGELGSQFLFNAYRSLLEGGTVLEHFARK